MISASSGNPTGGQVQAGRELSRGVPPADQALRRTASGSTSGDLSAIGWSGGPIEFLFVDAMKSWTLANSIVHDFYPALIPGSSIVVQQDFGSFYVYWLHLLTYRFREYFVPIYDLPCASSVAFKYVKQIPDVTAGAPLRPVVVRQRRDRCRLRGTPRASWAA